MPPGSMPPGSMPPNSVDAERALVGGEIHDELIPLLFASSASVHRLLADLQGKADESDLQRLTQVATWLNEAMKTGRGLLGDLLPPDFQHQTWQTAAQSRLEPLLEDSPSSTPGIPNIHWQIDDPSLILAPELALAALRITVEACRNAIRHGKAKQVKVQATTANDQFILQIQDDGTGFDAKEVPEGHFGITAMKARAHRVGGKLSIDSCGQDENNSGTIVKLTVPLVANVVIEVAQ